MIFAHEPIATNRFPPEEPIKDGRDQDRRQSHRAKSGRAGGVYRDVFELDLSFDMDGLRF